MTQGALLPRQQSQWKTLSHAIKQQRVPHALLIHGMPGIGKTQFAHYYCQTLLCENGAKLLEPCQQCHACKLWQSGNHLDFHVIAPEEKGKSIKIDQIRLLHERIHQAAQLGRYQIFFVLPAEAMNRAAANALLKNLEEPGPNTLFVLIADSLMPIPATIRSRCQLLAMPAPLHDDTEHQDDFKQFLQIYEDLQQQRINPINAAAKWQKLEMRPSLKSLQRILHARIKAISGQNVPLAQALIKQYQQVSQHIAYLYQQANPNPQLMWESIALSLDKALSQAKMG